MFFLSRASRPKSRPVVNQGRQSTRRLLLEALEDRVVPALIPSGWLVLSNAGGGSYPGGLYAINPDPKAPNHTPIPISAAGAFDESVGLAEDPSSGVLYSLDYGAGRSDNFSIKVPPSTGTTLARTMRDHALMKVDPTSGITSVVSYDSPGQENLYGSDAVVFLPGSGGSNGNLYVINQGDGGGNLHLLVNVEDNGYGYDPPTHSVLQIDPSGGSQMPVYDDGGHSTAPPNTDGAYPTGSDFINGYPDRTKSLDSGDKLHPFQGNPPDIAYGYSSPADDPSALNSGSPPSWINVPTGIAPVYDPNPNPQLPATLNTNFVYVADEQGPLDYHDASSKGTPQYQYGYDEGDPNLQGYIWKLRIRARLTWQLTDQRHWQLFDTTGLY